MSMPLGIGRLLRNLRALNLNAINNTETSIVKIQVLLHILTESIQLTKTNVHTILSVFHKTSTQLYTQTTLN